MCLHAVGKYEKVGSVNTQNDYETVSKNWTDKKKIKLFCVFCKKLFKFQENKFKIVQKSF